MHRSGRLNWIVAAIVVLIAVLGVLIFSAGESPSLVGNNFMIALAKGDAQALADRSYFNPPRSRDEIVKDWQKTTDIGKYYKFVWKIDSDTRPAKGRATVKMTVMRDLDNPSAYDENFSLDLISVNGKWMVDVRSLSREMYPGLPR